VWQSFELRVREIASYLWDSIAQSKNIAGVDFDCVLETKPGYWVIVEITEEKTLEKVRKDVNRLATARLSLFTENIFSDCFVVTSYQPTNSMKTTGDALHVKVLSAEDFEKLYFDFKSYVFARKKLPFGSLLITDEEEVNYVPVEYINENGVDSYSIEDIAKLLKRNKKIVLLGDYGTGKSCCLKQLFDFLTSSDQETDHYTFSINMRDHWGAQRAVEILDRHIEDLGINPERLKKTFTADNNIYLLDGFDEIGTQAWVADTEKMRSLRARSVVAIKDILAKVKGGVLLAGREQYFNSNSEMFESFGIDEKKIVIIRCKEEFSETEARQYIEENNFLINGEEATIPEWLPKRPLMMQLALKCTPAIFASDASNSNECDFWYNFLTMLCDREARINSILVPNVIKKILIYLGRVTRFKNDVGPITSAELADAFYEVTKERPNDESMVMLQRLPGIGRIGAQSQDRQFIDKYILNGLRAEDIIETIRLCDRKVYDEAWVHPMNFEGCVILSQFIDNKGQYKDFMSNLIQASRSRNHVFVADIASSLLLTSQEDIDFKGATVKETYVSDLCFFGKKIQGIEFSDCVISSIDITNSSFVRDVVFNRCEVATLSGVPSESGLPKAFVNSKVHTFQAIPTVYRIKHAKLTDEQVILVTIIKKTFFQPGSGRKEEALLRGLSGKFDNKTLDRILNKLLDEKILKKHKGNEGWIYSPERKEASRMKEMMSKLTLSDDPIWAFVSKQ